MKFVSLRKVRELLSELKNKTSSSIDQLDNFAVKVAADYIAGPLHHVITLSIMHPGNIPKLCPFIRRTLH